MPRRRRLEPARMPRSIAVTSIAVRSGTSWSRIPACEIAQRQLPTETDEALFGEIRRLQGRFFASACVAGMTQPNSVVHRSLTEMPGTDMESMIKSEIGLVIGDELRYLQRTRRLQRDRHVGARCNGSARSPPAARHWRTPIWRRCAATPARPVLRSTAALLDHVKRRKALTVPDNNACASAVATIASWRRRKSANPSFCLRALQNTADGRWETRSAAATAVTVPSSIMRRKTSSSRRLSIITQNMIAAEKGILNT